MPKINIFILQINIESTSNQHHGCFEINMGVNIGAIKCIKNSGIAHC